MPESHGSTPGSPLDVVGIAGSLRRGSYNRSLLRTLIALAPPTLRIVPFELGELPPYNADFDGDASPAPVTTFRNAIGAAAGLLIVTPEYNYGPPGLLKNALDWASRPSGKGVLTNRKVAIAGASPGMVGSVRAQTQLRANLHGTGSVVMSRPEIVVGTVDKKFDASGQLTDDATREHLSKFLVAFEAFLRG